MDRSEGLVKRAATLLLLCAAVLGCTTTVKNRNPVGDVFPTVRGTGLDGQEYRIPLDFEGEQVLLLVGYEMETQFDIDRWLLGLRQFEVDVPVYELPTIEGMLPGLYSGQIDEGMRSGIPREDWASVITVYDDARRIVLFTGSEKPRNARVLLLDEDGQVAWYHDRGYSPRLLYELALFLLEDSPSP